MLAVNRVADDLGSSYSVLFTSVNINECLGIAVRFVHFVVRFVVFVSSKRRFSNLDINFT